jgi:hypothetical protein
MAHKLISTPHPVVKRHTPEVGGVGEVFARAAAAFDERELGQVIGMAVTINTCNRINVTVGRNHPAAEFRD